MGLHDFTFYDLIDRNAHCFRERQCWFEVDDSRTLTFSEYKDLADRLAYGLQQQGIEKGDRIGVLAKNKMEFFILYGAAAALGAIMVPINWRLSADEVAYNLNDCGPKVVFTDQDHEETIQNVREKLPSALAFFNLEEEGGAFPGFKTLVENQGDFQPNEVEEDDGFVIIHTAAVAGRPRGALLSHENVLCANMTFDYLCRITPRDVHLNILPLFHVGGLFMSTASFHAGAMTVNMSKFDAEQAVQLIEEKKISFMMEFTPILGNLLEAHEKTGKDIGSLRVVTGLEGPETIERYQQMTQGTFYCMYGQTETSSFATFSAYNEGPGSAGRSVPTAQVRLVDDYDRPVSPGQVGEITMRGPMVFKGYWNLPEDTQQTFREGWHHTGDMGRFDDDGIMWYAGRKPEKELIKPGGENVYPAEVEKVILEHPAIERTVVFGVPDPKWKEGIKAVCRLKSGESLEAQELIDFVGARIARYKKPQYVEFVSEITLLEDGSPDRAKVKELYGGEE